MKNYVKKQIAFAAILAGLSSASLAQNSTSSSSAIHPVKTFSGTKGFRTWSIGITGGALAPVAAIGGSNDFTQWKPTLGYGLFIKNQFRHNIAVQAEFLRGTLEADNSKELGNGSASPSPYSSFKTDLNWAASLSGVVTLGNINWISEKNSLVPYLSLGAGLADYNPTLVSKTNSKIDYKPTGSITEFFVPVGGGLKFGVSDMLNIDLGYRMNFVDGDNLDGYTTGPSKDKFSYGFVGLEFSLGNKSKPQLITNNPVAQLKRDLQDENIALRETVSSTLQQNQKELQQKIDEVNALKGELEKMKTDSDGDGVSDYFDKCAGTANTEKVDGSGCPLVVKTEVIKEQPIVITEEDRRIVNEAIRDLRFDFGKAIIRSSSYTTLDRVANILVKKNFSLKLAGHTDNVGSESANLKLSKDRAESIKAYLVSKGANPSRIEATGYGETQPIASNKTEAGRQKNRRVEFTLY